MSFLSDAAEGNWSHLGTDLSHAGSSLMNHPTEMLELGGAAALGAAPFVLPELLGGAGALGGAAEGGGLFGGLGGLFGGGEAAAAGGADALALTGETGSAIAESPALTAIDSAIGGGANAGFDASVINPATGVDVLSGENPLLGGIDANPVTGLPAAGPTAHRSARHRPAPWPAS